MLIGAILYQKNKIMDWIYEPWPWYVAGPLLALTMFVLLFLGKQFGFSSNLRTMCTMGGAGKYADFFKIDWKKQQWNLLLLVGSVLGGFIASNFMSDNTVKINPKVARQLAEDYQIESAGTAYVPTEIFATENLTTPGTLLLLGVAGFMVGFGARYAGGCTSGHAISGLSNFQFPSLIAVFGFFIGGLMMIHLLFPFIF